MPTIPKLRQTGNQLLDRIPHEEFAGLRTHLQPVDLPLKQVVQEYEAEIRDVWFPTTALLSVLIVPEEDDPVEVAEVAREGFVNAVAALGVDEGPNRVICQMAGAALRLPVAAFREALGRSPGLTRLAHRYIAFMLQCTARGLACNALHLVEARACRWILTAHDQVGQDEFPLTQEFLAFMLGVRRQTVTVVAGTLQNAGLIEYRRGSVAVRDRGRLEDAACECYALNRDYYERVVC
jgi:CRP-like cAMP-binding protein